LLDSYWFHFIEVLKVHFVCLWRKVIFLLILIFEKDSDFGFLLGTHNITLLFHLLLRFTTFESNPNELVSSTLQIQFGINSLFNWISSWSSTSCIYVNYGLYLLWFRVWSNVPSLHIQIRSFPHVPNLETH
jgi:hypothetical protein